MTRRLELLDDYCERLFEQWVLLLGVHDINMLQQWRQTFEQARRALAGDTEDPPAPLTLWEGRLGETWCDFGPETFTIEDHHAFTIWHPYAAVKRMLEQRLGKHVRIEVHIVREGEAHGCH